MIEIRRYAGRPDGFLAMADTDAAPAFEQLDIQVAGWLGERPVIRSGRALRYLKPGQAPVIFLPPAALALKHVRASGTLRMDEFGLAIHLSLSGGGRTAADALWYYPGPDPEYAPVAGMLCLDPSLLDRVTADGQVVCRGDLPGTWRPAGHQPCRAPCVA